MSVSSIAARKNPDLPGRQSLKEAITAATAAHQEMVAIKAAVERAEGLAWDGRRKVEKARAAVTAAKAEDAEALADSLVQGAGTTPLQTTRRAREEKIEAVDALEAARSAVTRLEVDLKEAEHAAERASKDVNVAIAAVLKPIALRLTEEAKHLRAEYLKRQHVLDALCMRLDGFTRLDFSVQDREYRALCASFRQPWLDAIEALKRDPDAPLPG